MAAESAPDHHRAGDSSPKLAAESPKNTGAESHNASPKLKPAEKSDSPKHKPADHSPKNANATVSPRHKSNENPAPSDDLDDMKPSAVDLAKKRAERFGIPLIANTEDVKKTRNEADEDSTENAVEESAGDKRANLMEKYRDLLASSLPENSIIVVEDLIGDSRNANLFQKVIDKFGEEKIKEIIAEVVKKIGTDFNNDRTSIDSPPRLAGFRVSRALKAALPKLEKPERKQKEEKPTNKKNDKKDDAWKKKWTDEEWAEWNKKKEETGGWKKKDWGDWKKGQGEWKSNDWNSGDKRKNYGNNNDKWDSKKKRSDSYDAFESDVDEFIYRNKLDKKAAKILREETKGMVTYVMDQGFDLKRFDNPSREVMLRCKDYMKMKRGVDRGGKDSRSYSAKSRSRSRSRSYHSRSDGGRGSGDRSLSRGRSRSNSRDQYRDRSRSPSV